MPAKCTMNGDTISSITGLCSVSRMDLKSQNVQKASNLKPYVSFVEFAQA